MVEEVRIKVIGVGGAGGNAVNGMISDGVGGVEYIVMNTDAQDLNTSLADVRIQLGEKLTKGHGAGSKPDVGKASVEESKEKIVSILENTDMLFITAGMGGGTGTGAAPEIAKLAKEMGVLTIAVVTKPFDYEGKKRIANAIEGVAELEKYVDSLIVIPNSKLYELPDKEITLQNAFREANDVLKTGIKGMADLIIGQGIINLDFADIKNILSNSGVAILGYGEASGENRVVEAVDKALKSPLLERTINGAGKVLINIVASSGLTLVAINSITRMAQEASGKELEDVMLGVTSDDSFGDKLRVIIIANSFDDQYKNNNEEELTKVESNYFEEEYSGNTDKVNEEEFSELSIPPWNR